MGSSKISSNDSTAPLGDLQTQPVQFTGNGCNPTQTVKPSVNRQQRTKSTSILQVYARDIQESRSRGVPRDKIFTRRKGMKVVLSAIFLVLSLVCGVQGQAECVQEEYDDFWEGGSGPMPCGCQLYDESDTPLVNISLDFFDTLEANEGLDVTYTYSPCTGNTKCNNDTTAVCRHVRLPGLSYKSIGMLDNVNYTVNNVTSVNISATYLGEDDESSVVYLVCDETAKGEGKFSFVRRDRSKKIYYFQLKYFEFCLPLTPTMTTTKTMTPTNSTTTTMTTNSTTTTMTTNSTTTTMTTNSTTTMTTNSTTTTMTTNSTTKTMTTTNSTNTMTTTTTSTTKLPTMTITSTSTSSPSENKNDNDRKVVLGVVLSIVGAIIVGVILAIVVYFLWKKKRGASYEKIPTM